MQPVSQTRTFLVAAAFARLLTAELPEKTMLEVVKRNAAERDINVCHSHDFADPNPLMARAIAEVCNEAIDDMDPALVESLWDAAWQKAKVGQFNEWNVLMQAADEVPPAEHAELRKALEKIAPVPSTAAVKGDRVPMPLTVMSIARRHAAELRASLLLLNGQVDAVAGLTTLDLIAMATRLDDTLGALDGAIRCRAVEAPVTPPARKPALIDCDPQHLGAWKLPTTVLHG